MADGQTDILLDLVQKKKLKNNASERERLCGVCVCVLNGEGSRVCATASRALVISSIAGCVSEQLQYFSDWFP